MQGLCTTVLGTAFRIFLRLAYPDGDETIPPPRRVYLAFRPDQPLDDWLVPPICQPTLSSDGRLRGYAWRLGCRHFAHLKLRVTWQDQGACWVFSVDTHDTVRVARDQPDAVLWAQLQQANRRLQEE